MKIIVGLGNPGEEYALTRHNVGFRFVYELASHWGISNSSYRFDGLLGQSRYAGEKIFIFQPLKYMNNSGLPLRKIFDYYKLSVEDLLVVYDDLDLPVGKMRFKANGGDGGHNGIKSIINHLGTDQIPRLKLGIGRPPDQIPVTNYVLGKFAGEEEKLIKETIGLAIDSVELMLKDGLIVAMNKYN